MSAIGIQWRKHGGTGRQPHRPRVLVLPSSATCRATGINQPRMHELADGRGNRDGRVVAHLRIVRADCELREAAVPSSAPWANDVVVAGARRTVTASGSAVAAQSLRRAGLDSGARAESSTAADLGQRREAGRNGRPKLGRQQRGRAPPVSMVGGARIIVVGLQRRTRRPGARLGQRARQRQHEYLGAAGDRARQAERSNGAWREAQVGMRSRGTRAAARRLRVSCQGRSRWGRRASKECARAKTLKENRPPPDKQRRVVGVRSGDAMRDSTVRYGVDQPTSSRRAIAQRQERCLRRGWKRGRAPATHATGPRAGRCERISRWSAARRVSERRTSSRQVLRRSRCK